MEAFLITVLMFFTLWIIVMVVAVSKSDAPALRGRGYSRRGGFGSTLAAATMHEVAHAGPHSHWHDAHREHHEVADAVHFSADVDIAAHDVEIDDSDVIESSALGCDMDLEDTTTFEYGDSSCDIDSGSSDD